MRSSWISLSLGWLAGGLSMITAYYIAQGNNITNTVVFGVGDSVTTVMDLGISNENIFIILALFGLVEIFSSSGDWI